MEFIKKNINTLLLTLYISLIWISYTYLNFYSQKFFWVIVLEIILVSAIVSYIAILAIKDKDLKQTSPKHIGKRITVLAVVAAVSLAYVLYRYYTYYPGGFSGDSDIQYLQAMDVNPYNDWHPAWHTFVFFRLPLLVTGERSFIVLLQMIYFAFTLGYMGMVIYKHTNIQAVILTTAYILLNPYTGNIIIYPWKDVGFAIACCLAATMTFEIYMSREWGSWWRMMLLGLVLANATLFRHNGILFTAALLVALFFFLSKKQAIIMTVTFVLFLVIVKGPVYGLLGVEKPEQRTIETMGLPITIIGNVAREAPDKLDGETAEFIYSIAPRECWENQYVIGDFNSVKFLYADRGAAEVYGKKKIVMMALRCFRYAPAEAWKGAIALTDTVYGLDYYQSDADPYYTVLPYDREVDADREALINSHNGAFIFSIFKYSGSVGMAMLLTLMVILAKSDLSSFRDWKRLFLGLPIFVHNFGTMLLLSGPDVRFFFLTYLVCPLIIVMMLLRRGAVSGKE
ncbi:MAG: hypothetical protein IJ757_08695 [Clostridiales bacterium]|nr:hypothetical protein [Clostridiales bacterium]